MNHIVNRKEFYEKPTQVIFTEYDDNEDEIGTFAGIAFNDIVICGECGHVSHLNDPNIWVKEELPWIDISEAIEGD